MVFFTLFLLFTCIVAPPRAHAGFVCSATGCDPVPGPGDFPDIPSCQAVCAKNFSDQNPLCLKGFKPACNFSDLCITYGFLINLASFGAAALTLVMFLYGSFKYVTASGAEEALATARKVITNAAIGLVLVSISYILMRIILTVTGQTVVCF